MRFWITLFVLLAILFGGLRAFGQEATCQAKKDECRKADTAQTAGGKMGCAASAGCHGAKEAKAGCDKTASDKAVLAAMPALLYKVGDKELCCDKMAGEAAKESGKPMIYLVAGKEYENAGEAQTAYADVLGKHLESMLEVKYAIGDECVNCPLAAEALAKKCGGKVQYQLAAFKFADKEAAEKAAKAAREAAEKVQTTLAVGSETYDCPTHAEQAAKRAGCKVEYCVGQAKTTCKVTAKVELAKARIMAAYRTLAEVAGT